MRNMQVAAGKFLAVVLVGVFVIFSSGCIVLPHGHRHHGHHAHHDSHGKIGNPHHSRSH